MTIGAKIRKVRMLRGYTQAQLGAMVHLTGDRIRQYENNVRSPKESKLQEIADALDVNISAISEPELEHPASVLHTFFELEELFGLHVEKAGNNYHLCFSAGEFPGDPDTLMEFLDGWYNERKNFQPDLNDSSETIAVKKQQYEIWKAKFPYSVYEKINEQFNVVKDFMDSADKLLDNTRTAVKTFSEFYGHLLALGDTGLPIFAKHNSRYPSFFATFTIKCADILNLKGDAKMKFAEFRRDLYDLKGMGFRLEEKAKQINNETYAFYEINSPQIATLCSDYNKLMETKKSPSFDEDFYNMEIEDTMQMFNIPIEDYIPAYN